MTGLRRTTRALCLLPVVLCGCSGQNARAPVLARPTAPEPAARIYSPHGHVAATAPADVASADSYVVRRGDTLYSIAWQQGTDVQRLARTNHISPPYTIYQGQRLRLSGRSPGPAPAGKRVPLQVRPLPAPVPQIPRPLPATRPVPETAGKAPPSAPSRTATASIGPDYDGKWVWPTRGKVLRGFREAGNGKKGIDIGGRAGQPVVAAANGKVVYVGSGLVGYGRLIIVKHNESLLSAYGHNSQLLVAEGDNVTAGQTIAKMGNSGTNRTMLYFEIRKDGKPVNPVNYLP
jgi:lipoprotein NlpD